MSTVLIYYVVGLLVCVGGFFASFLVMKNILKKKVHWGGFFAGILFSFIYFAGALLLINVTFDNENYYNTAVFRTMISLVYFLLLALLRLFITKVAFFDRYKERSGLSFCFGFGFAPTAFLGLYLLIMFFVVAINGILNGPCVLEAEGYLSFADNTIISVFQPAAGHLSFAIVFTAYSGIALANGVFQNKIFSKRYHLVAVVSWVILLAIVEALAIVPIPLIKQFGFTHWQLALIEVICAGITFVLARFIPGEERTRRSDYQKQFE